MKTNPFASYYADPTAAGGPADLPWEPEGFDAAGRALVLGGGGSTGNAWLIGIIAGLLKSGLDVTPADLTIGTSAGATAAFQMAGTAPAELYGAILAEAPASRSAPARAEQGTPPRRPLANHLERITTIIAGAHDAADMHRKMGASALGLDAESDGSWAARWRETVAARMTSLQWPQRTVLTTAVDAHTGDPVVFGPLSGVDPADAVAASCSSGLPYRIGSRRYIDGGYRRNENADLAAGHGRILVLSPFGGSSLHPKEWGMDLESQVAELRALGSRVETVGPDSAAGHLFGTNAMNLSLRPEAARAGYAQGRTLAGPLTEFWA